MEPSRKAANSARAACEKVRGSRTEGGGGVNKRRGGEGKGRAANRARAAYVRMS